MEIEIFKRNIQSMDYISSDVVNRLKIVKLLHASKYQIEIILIANKFNEFMKKFAIL
jgi:hypothetical protein